MTRKHRYILAGSLLAAGALALALALVLRSRSAGARAQPQIERVELGKPAYGGTGCPGGTARAVLSEDRRTLSMLFDRYVAETGRGQQFDRKSCSLAVPIEVPEGLSVSLLRVDYRGFAKIPEDGHGAFRAEYFFAGSTGPEVLRSFGPGYQDDFLLRDRVSLPVWSACGEEVIARVNSSATAEKASSWSSQEAQVIVDTADIEAGILFRLEWRDC